MKTKKPARKRAKRLTLANLSTAFAALDARVRMTEIETKRLLESRHVDKLRSYAAMYGADPERLAFMGGRAWGKTAAMHAAMGGDPAELTKCVDPVPRVSGTVTGLHNVVPSMWGETLTMSDGKTGEVLAHVRVQSLTFTGGEGVTLEFEGEVIPRSAPPPEPPFKLTDLVRVTSGRKAGLVGGVDWVGKSTYSQRPDYLAGEPVLGLILPATLRPGQPAKRIYLRAADCEKTTVEREMTRFAEELRGKLTRG